MILEYVIQWKTHMQVLLVITFSKSYDIIKCNDSPKTTLRL